MRKYSTRGGWDFGNRLKCKGDIKAILEYVLHKSVCFFKKKLVSSTLAKSTAAVRLGRGYRIWHLSAQDCIDFINHTLHDILHTM